MTDKIKKTPRVKKSKAEKELSGLKSKYRSVLKELKEIDKDKGEIGIMANAIDTLPLDTLKDFNDYQESSHLKNPILLNIKKIRELRKKQEKKLEELDSLSREIKVKNIDIILEKIKSIDGYQG